MAIMRVLIEDEKGSLWEVDPHNVLDVFVATFPIEWGNAPVAASLSEARTQELVQIVEKEESYKAGAKIFENAFGKKLSRPEITKVSGINVYEALSLCPKKPVFGGIAFESTTDKANQKG